MRIKKRPTKDEYYLYLARQVATRATCLRRHFGAVIVKEDQIVSTGYVGAPRATPNCIDIGFCAREQAGIPSGERYELCRSVHAEANAIINAARAGVNILGGTMYLSGTNVSDGSIAEGKPCKMCQRMIINAGIKEVIVRTPDGMKRYWVDHWVKEDKGYYTDQNIHGY